MFVKGVNYNWSMDYINKKKEKEKQEKIQPTFKTIFNKEKNKQKESDNK